MPSDHPLSQISQLLRNTPAFAGLSPETCERLATLTGERTLQAGEYLAHEGDTGDELFLVLSGRLLLSRRTAHHGSDKHKDIPFDSLPFSAGNDSPIPIGEVGPGEVVGELSLLTGHPRPATIQADQITVVRSLTSVKFDVICAERPEEMATTIAWMVERVDTFQIAAAIEESTLFRQLPDDAKRDLAARFARVDCRAGEMLFREGESGDALYLILSGRMRLVLNAVSYKGMPTRSEASQTRVLAELGKGDLLGELSLLTGDVRSDSAIAVRDSHLARLDKAHFDHVVAAYPTEMLGLFSRQLAGRLRDRNVNSNPSRRVDGTSEGGVPVAIAVLPLNPMEQSGGGRDFASELVRQLSAFGPTLHLTRAVISRVFPENRGFESRFNQASVRQNQIDAIAERRLLVWLDDLEMLYRHVVYEADYQTGVAESAWTSRCLRQADVLLMVAGGPADPKDSEKTMVRLSSKALPSVKTTLVLIHSGTPDSVSHTRIWESSLGVKSHEHVRRVGTVIHSGDVGRIARKLNRQSVGLVLGGGFALGLAHIGVIDAMRELEIPIDFVGGTSMGAIIAAACAMEFSHDQMLEVMDKGCAQALKGDYTFPIVSLLTGKKVALALGKYLEHKDIEDFWLSYFAISASLVKARMVVHREGSALKSVLASCRAPGMFPPLGWNGDVLVDGGLVNNIPADVMRDVMREPGHGDGHDGQRGGTVFAADVSPDSEFLDGNAEAQFGMALSGWKVARRNSNPLRRFKRSSLEPKHATIADILMRLIRLGGVAHNRQIRASADLYMAIPLERFSVKDFHRGEEMARAGYEFSRQALEQWMDQNGRPWLGHAK